METGRTVVAKGDGGLTDRQKRFVEAIEGGQDDLAAMEVAGYSSGESLGSVGTSEPVQAALRRGRIAKLTGGVSRKALDRIERLITDDRTPAATAFAASKWVLEQAGHVIQADQGHAKPVGEMTEAELEAFIRRAEQVIAGGGSPPVIEVVPGNGA